ncbi:tRNA (guanosine(37)-N1)-methyltransferase TrmD [Numidum massiliense]|uniref:tRNA (guanosine(37)-N1)-methyltransferase TrmD n=1 Tax=Numidum massiliense TaxID=1522315 RepID=UPI0006D52C3F|nr:tRNA (guanosine(37)-N1)-methyltransferase TrmD [Numidum massiliense]
MHIHILTLFPEMFAPVLQASIIGKAIANGKVSVDVVNFRDFSDNKHRTVDEPPYGGGGGMLLRPQPIFSAVEHVLATRDGAQPSDTPSTGERPTCPVGEGQSVSVGEPQSRSAAEAQLGSKSEQLPFPTGKPQPRRGTRIVLLTPQGERFEQRKAAELAQEDHLVLICGHYEGFDERIRTHLATDELSLGDYVLTGGELAAMVVVDSVTRLLPGVLGNEQSAHDDSHAAGLLEYPQYTRPASFRGWTVPDVLLSGNHAEIAKWRRQEAIRRTWERRPDLLREASLSDDDREFLAELANETDNT